MKKNILAFCSASLLLFACNSEGTNADNKKDSVTTTTTTTTTEPDKKDESGGAMPDSATQMKNWQAYMTPGDVHKMMASWDGNWNGEVISWHAANGPSDTNKVTTINKMIMGGRYQSSTSKGNMMGMQFEGMSTLAYDNMKKVFVSTWIDNMGTGMMKLEGPWDEASKSMTLKGKCVNPGTGKESDVWEKFTIKDNNTQLMEMYGPGMDGKEMKMMQITFTRK